MSSVKPDRCRGAYDESQLSVLIPSVTLHNGIVRMTCFAGASHFWGASRHHVELTASAMGYCIKDVGSLNGTYLNGERIEDSEALLTNGDELQVGKFKLLYLVSSST